MPCSRRSSTSPNLLRGGAARWSRAVALVAAQHGCGPRVPWARPAWSRSRRRPPRDPATRSYVSVWAVTMMIGTMLLARIVRQTSNPPMSGRRRSSSTRSGSCAANMSRPVLPSAASPHVVALVLEREGEREADRVVVLDEQQRSHPSIMPQPRSSADSVTEIAHKASGPVTNHDEYGTCSRCLGGVPTSPWCPTCSGDRRAAEFQFPTMIVPTMVVASPTQEVPRMLSPILIASTDSSRQLLVMTVEGPLVDPDHVEALRLVHPCRADRAQPHRRPHRRHRLQRVVAHRASDPSPRRPSTSARP